MSDAVQEAVDTGAPAGFESQADAVIESLKNDGQAQSPSGDEGDASADTATATHEDNKADDGADSASADTTDKHAKEDTSEPIKMPAKPTQSEWMALKQREKAVRDERTAWEKEKAELTERASLADKVKARAGEDVQEALKMLGYEDPRKFLEELASTGGKITPEMKRQRELEAKVAKWEQEKQERAQQDEQAAHQAKVDAAVKQWHANIAEHIKGDDGLKDSLVRNVPGTEQAVFQIMQKHYEDTQEEMPISDAVAQANKNMEQYVNSMLGQIVASARGRAIVQEIVSRQSRSGAASQSAPSVQQVRNQTTQRTPKGKLRSFDEQADEIIKLL